MKLLNLCLEIWSLLLRHMILANRLPPNQCIVVVAVPDVRINVKSVAVVHVRMAVRVLATQRRDETSAVD